ncbi:hypothetical protein KEJ48_05870, partial [Candidatus Bathyarchaeota archaeon]|nr:hypothetical protein [Candidatus Bathyarchaeota archaeon]
GWSENGVPKLETVRRLNLDAILNLES